MEGINSKADAVRRDSAKRERWVKQVERRETWDNVRTRCTCVAQAGGGATSARCGKPILTGQRQRQGHRRRLR